MYFLTTLDSKNDDTRCVGYFKTFEEAEEIILSNMYDVWETCYDYAVIENVKEGIYQYDFHPVWYKYNKLTGGYIRCDRPDFVGATSVGYSIG